MLYLYIASLFLIGLFVGSFLGVLVDRIPANKSFIKGRSYCENCKHALGVLDLIPVLSFIFLQGKCRYCKHKLSFFYPLIEISTGVLFALSFYLTSHSFNIDLFYYLFVVSVLIVVFFTDLKYGIIPDKIFFPSIVVSFLYLLFFNRENLIVNLLTAVCVFAFFLTVSIVFNLITKKEGMGGGDIKFSFVLGLILGFPNVIVALYTAFLTACFVSIILILWRKKRLLGDSIPFGPFLVLGTLSAIFFGSAALTIIPPLLGSL